MSVLTDADILQQLNSTDGLRIRNLDEDYLTPVGYDLRAGGLCVSSADGKLQILAKDEKIALKPGSTTLISTLEEIEMPMNRGLSGFIFSKVSLVSKGLSHVSTTIDPDWKGRLVIAIHNHSRSAIEISFGQPFCTLVFLTNKSGSQKPSKREGGRNDLFMRTFAQRNALNIKRAALWVLARIVLICAAAAALVYYSTPEMNLLPLAYVVAGGGIFQWIDDFLRKRADSDKSQ